MRLLRSRNGHVALELDGNIIIKFVRNSATGPILDAAERKSFFRQYNTVLSVQPFEAVCSFLATAKRGYNHSQDVCDNLWEIIMSKNFSDQTLAELIACYNKLALALNKPPRKSFSSKADALSAIERLDVEVKSATPTQLVNEGKKMTTTVDENGNEVQVADKKPRGKGIGKRAMELILEGKTNEEVIKIVKDEIEGANPTPATCAWYRNKLRQEGKLPPSTRGKKDEAAPEAEESDEEEAA